MDCNSHKGGSDTFDQMCYAYTTARKTRRWRHCYGTAFTQLQTKKKHGAFFLDSGYSLIQPHLTDRLQTATLRRPLRMAIEEILVVVSHGKLNI